MPVLSSQTGSHDRAGEALPIKKKHFFAGWLQRNLAIHRNSWMEGMIMLSKSVASRDLWWLKVTEHW